MKLFEFELRNSDLILIAEKSLLPKLARREFAGKLVFLDEEAAKMGIQLRDPIGFNPQELEDELYLHAFVSSFILNNKISRKSYLHDIVGLIPRSIEAFPKMNKFVEDLLIEREVLILQTSIGKAPYLNQSRFQSMPIPNRFADSFSSFILDRSKIHIFHFEHELLNPTLNLCSVQWRQNIEVLSRQINVILLSAPLITSNGTFDFNSYLGVLPSNSFSMIY